MSSSPGGIAAACARVFAKRSSKVAIVAGGIALVTILLLQMPTLRAAQGQGQAQASARQPQAPEVVRELVGRRRANSATYELSDGTFRTSIYPTPIHYRDGRRWRRIDNNVVQTPGGSLRNTAGDHRVTFPERLDRGWVRIEREAESVALRLRDAAPAAARARGARVHFDDVLPNVSLRYSSLGQGLKEDIELAGSDVPADFAFDLDLSRGLVAQPRRDGGVDLRDAGGAVAFSMPPAFMTDAAGASEPVPMRVRGRTLVLDPSERWLRSPDRRFPVVIDPSVLYGTVRDCHIDARTPDTSLCTAAYLEGGRSSTGSLHALLQFDLGTAIPKQAKILDAKMQLDFVSASTRNTKDLGFYRAGRVWDNAATWNSAQAGARWTQAGGDVAGAQIGKWSWVDGRSAYPLLYLTNVVKGWRDGTLPNHGILVKDENPTVTNVLRFHSSEATVSASMKPRLSVEWADRLGTESHYSYVTETSGPIALSVNVGNGNLVARVPGLRRPGTGIDVDVTYHYNSLGATRWTDNFWDVALSAGGQADLYSREFDVYQDGTGARFVFERDPATGTWKSPEGIDAQRVTLTSGHKGIRYSNGVTLRIPGSLWEKFDAAGNRVEYHFTVDELWGNLDGGIRDTAGAWIDFNRSQSPAYDEWVEPEGRRHTHKFGTGGIIEQVRTDGRRDRFLYGTPNDQLVRVEPADGPPLKLTYDAQNRVKTITRVTDTATDTGPTTTFDYLAPALPCDPAKYIAMTTVTAPDGDQTAYCADWELRGDKVAPAATLANDLETAAQQIDPAVPASAYALDVGATDAGIRQRGVKRIEVLVDGQAVHDTGKKPCTAGGCPLDTNYLLRPQWYAPGDRKVTVVTTDQVNNVRRDERTIKVPSEPSNTAGLEKWFQYDTVQTGADTQARVNLSTGNLVWQGVPVFNLGRGLSTFVTLTYNSADKGGQGQHEGGLNNEADGPNYGQVGQNFSLGVSGMTRLNEPLVVSNDTGGIVTLYDADGTRHRFKKSGDGVTFDPPPGVNLHLRKYSTTDFVKSWAITRPDGVTYFFDRLGYQRQIEDRNGNVIRFDYEPLPNANPANCTSGKTAADLNCKKRVIAVVDSAGVVDVPAAPNRTVQVRYYPQTVPASDGNAAGRIKEIVDHAGRITAFRYDDRGFLVQLIQAQGTLDERSFQFAYQGEGQERNLSAVTDPRGNATQIFYEQQGGPMKRVLRLVNRRGKERRYAYDTQVTQGVHYELATVTDARGFDTSHRMDARHRPIEITDPLGTRTVLEWDADNNVSRFIEAAGTADEAITSMTYNANGLPLTRADGENRTTTLAYRDGAGVHLSGLGTDAGKAYVSDLLSVRRPKGNTYSFGVDARGNVEKVTDPDNFFTTAVFDARGQVREEVDEVGNKTTYQEHDPNGLPRLIVDPRGNATGADPLKHRWILRFDTVGNLIARTDPRGATTGGVSDPRTLFTASFTYDALDRQTLMRIPKRSTLGQYIERRFRYDRNGNLEEQTDGNNASWTSSYTPMDLPEELRSPPVDHADESVAAREVTKLRYDAEDALEEQIAPMAETTTVAGAYTTRFVRDQIGRVTATIRQSREASRSEDIVTSYAYDRRDNVIGAMDPEGNRRAGGDPSLNAKNEAIRRFTYRYDKADNRRFEIEEPGRRNFVTETVFDANDNVEKLIDARGDKRGDKPAFTTTYGYDGRDLLRTIVEPGGATTRYLLRGDGRLEKLIRPNGEATTDLTGDFTTEFTYFPTGEVKTQSIPWARDQYGPRNWKVVYDRNPVGDPEKITDGRGQLITSTFYDTGDLLTTDKPSWWGFQPGTGDDPAPEGEIVESGPRGSRGGTGADDQLPSSEAKNDFGDVQPKPLPDLLPRAGSTTFDFDGEMRLKSVTNGGVTKTLTRDATGRVAAVSFPFDATRSVVNRFGYDRNGNLRRFEDGENHAFTTVLDQFDRPIEERSPGANEGTETTLYGYDANDNLLTTQTPRGPVWRNGYDTIDRLVSRRNPLGDESKLDYDEVGNQVFERSPKGNVAGLTDAERAKFTTTRVYDARNLLRSIQNGLGHITTIDYDANANATKITEPGARATPDGPIEPQVTDLTYDGRDLEWTRSTGTGVHRRITVTEFDANSNLRRVVYPAGVDGATGRPRWVDDGGAPLSAMSDANRHATVNTYDRNDLLVTVDLPWGSPLGSATDPKSTARYRQDVGRDARGRITAVESVYQWSPSVEKVGRTTYTYFDTDWVKTSTDPPLLTARDPYDQTLTYDYDKRGLQTLWRSNRKTRTIARTFHPNGQLNTRTASADGEVQRRYEYRWNRNGRLTSFIDLEQRPNEIGRTTSIFYDDADRERIVDERWDRGRDTWLTYDPNDNVTLRRTDGQVSNPETATPGYTGGRTAAFAYDELDRDKETIVCPQGGATCTATSTEARKTTRSYHPSDQLSDEVRWNGLTEQHFYFNDGRLSQMRRQRAGQTTFDKDQSYTYDADGNRTKDERGEYVYNARDQLIWWKRGGRTSRAGSIVNYVVDGRGRMLQRTDAGITTTFNYVGERLESELTGSARFEYHYDEFGSVKQVSGAGFSQTFTYDAFERLIKTASTPDGPAGSERDATYTYDGLDRRDRKTATVTTGTGTEQRTLDYSYIGLTDRLSRQEQLGGQPMRFDYDAQLNRLAFQRGTSPAKGYGMDASGSVEELQRSDGTVDPSERYYYDPYGGLELNNGSTPPPGTDPEQQLSPDARENPFRFHGHYYDAGAKAYDMQAREYLPRSGRFLSQDRYEDAFADMRIATDVLTGDRFVFAGANPVNNIDLDGHDPHAQETHIRGCFSCKTSRSRERAAARATARSLRSQAAAVGTRPTRSSGASQARPSGQGTPSPRTGALREEARACAAQIEGNVANCGHVGVPQGKKVSDIFTALDIASNAGGPAALAAKTVLKRVAKEVAEEVFEAGGKKAAKEGAESGPRNSVRQADEAAAGGKKWPRGTHGNAGPVPDSVKAALAGRTFRSRREFRSAFWKAVSDDPALVSQFDRRSQRLMRRGLAPFAAKRQWLGGRRRYELHHKTPVGRGGAELDVDNIIVTTPRYHKEVLEPRYHYGGRR